MIPDRKSIYFPYLLVLSDGQEWRFQNITKKLARQLKVSAIERKVMMPAGDKKRFDCHVGWVRTICKKDGYVESTRHGFVRITDKGMTFLSKF